MEKSLQSKCLTLTYIKTIFLFLKFMTCFYKFVCNLLIWEIFLQNFLITVLFIISYRFLSVHIVNSLENCRELWKGRYCIMCIFFYTPDQQCCRSESFRLKKSTPGPHCDTNIYFFLPTYKLSLVGWFHI